MGWLARRNRFGPWGGKNELVWGGINGWCAGQYERAWDGMKGKNEGVEGGVLDQEIFTHKS